MGGLLLILTLTGAWLFTATLFDWDWSLGTLDFQPAEEAVGDEALRWGICLVGFVLMFIGMGGLSW
ncbi:MAG TPA: hypothetical protein VKE74_15355 [Gemmataceae bacterium]|nr:hypothetical protein [Gemmataceae bacterium]